MKIVACMDAYNFALIKNDGSSRVHGEKILLK